MTTALTTLMTLSTLLAVDLPPLEEVDTETRSGRLTRYLMRVMEEIAPVPCPEAVIVDPGERVYRCASFSGDFGDWKAAWDFNMTRHGLPETPSSRTPWSTGPDAPRYRREYDVGTERWIVELREAERIVVFSIPWEAQAGDGGDERVRPRMAGFGGIGVPRLIDASRIEPAYPAEAGDLLLTGSVVLEAVVGADGAVEEVEVLREEPPQLGFGAAARSAVARWRYEPVTVDGVAIAVKMPVYVTIEPPAEAP